jgi:hypothetical protein
MAERLLALPPGNPREARHAPKPQPRNPRMPRRAEECTRLAKTAVTAGAINDYLEMEQRWLALARSYEFAERLSNFTEPFRNRKQPKE